MNIENIVCSKEKIYKAKYIYNTNSITLEPGYEFTGEFRTPRVGELSPYINKDYGNTFHRVLTWTTILNNEPRLIVRKIVPPEPSKPKFELGTFRLILLSRFKR